MLPTVTVRRGNSNMCPLCLFSCCTACFSMDVSSQLYSNDIYDAVFIISFITSICVLLYPVLAVCIITTLLLCAFTLFT